MKTSITNRFYVRLAVVLCAVLSIGLASCNDGKSYSDLLDEEEHAVNWYLAQCQVETQFPEEGYIYGENAPFYRMNKSGTIYMKVLDPGNLENRPEKGQTVYFRYMRMNIKNYRETHVESWSGNAEEMNTGMNGASFIYGNKVLSSTTQYGDGIQVPLHYLGYDCHVMLIVKSIEGWSGDISDCIPYLYDIRYFKAEY